MVNRTEDRSTFDWGSEGEEEQALRLPTGVAAAERLARRSGDSANERSRPVSQAVLAVPALLLLLVFAVGGAVQVARYGPTLSSGISTATPGVERARPNEDTWIRERLLERQREAEAQLAAERPAVDQGLRE